MNLSALLACLPPALRPASPPAADPEITAIAFDSRRVTPGALFIAIRGEITDGHRFIPEALARGAAAIAFDDPALAPSLRHSPAPTIHVPSARETIAHLAAAWHGFPARRLAMIGVTGTDGKTTTASLIHHMLRAAGLRAGLISTVSAVIGEQSLDTGFHVTTPDAPAVQALLARAAGAGLTHCVLEATSHGLAQGRVTACEFDVAALTNITHEHLDYHRTFEDYRAAKARLFDFLADTRPKPDAPPPVAVLNRDDPSYPYLSSRTVVRQISYSLTPTGDLRAGNVTLTPGGLSFDVAGPGFAFRARVPLAGYYNLSNCLAALGVTVCALGVDPEVALRALAEFPGVPGRMERVDVGQPFTALVDFAHTPNALRRALETARQFTTQNTKGTKPEESFEAFVPFMMKNPGRLIAVLGSAGLRDRQKRRLMAEVAAALADFTVLTAEDPRTESLAGIMAEMAAGCEAEGGVEGRSYWRIPDRGEALRFAVRLARPGDVVIACGKGHEQSMCFGETEYPWDDRLALRAALAELLGLAGPQMPHLPPP